MQAPPTRPALWLLCTLSSALSCALPACTCSSTTDGAAPGAKPPGALEGGMFLNVDGGLTGFRIDPGSVDLTVNPASGKPDPIQFTVTGGGGSAVTWKHRW